jgi:molybdenum cofactor guanylyltransferase
MNDETAAVILAGGEGSRIGGNKPLQMLGGERLIDRALRQARRWSDLVAIAVRAPTQVEPIEAMLLADDPDVEGPLGGVMAALKFGRDQERDFVLTIPADMPFLPPDLLNRFTSAVRNVECALSSSGGHLHPVCGLWRTTVLREAGHYLEGHRRSLKGLAELVGFATVEWPADPIDPFFNINSPGDLSRAEQLL